MAVAISEPDAGSAATDMTTKAVREGDHYRVNGAKRWISNSGHAELYLLYVRLDDAPGSKGIGALVVEKDMDGVSFGVPEKLMGFRGIPSCDIYFEDVLVPAENLLVGPGDGFRKLFGAFSMERLGNATVSLAIAQASLDRSVEYVTTREQFGKPLIEFQAVQTDLADMVVLVEAARLLVYRAAREAGTGAARQPAGLDREAGGQRGRQEGLRAGHRAARRQRLRRGVRHRAAAPRRPRLGDRRRYADDAAGAHRLGAARPPLRPARAERGTRSRDHGRPSGHAAARPPG